MAAEVSGTYQEIDLTVQIIVGNATNITITFCSSSVLARMADIITVVEDDIDYYVSTEGDDDTGLGTEALPWATPQGALHNVRRIYFVPGVTVNFHFADGTYQMDGNLLLDHICGKQFNFIGNLTDETGFPVTNFGYSGLTSSCWISISGDHVEHFEDDGFVRDKRWYE